MRDGVADLTGQVTAAYFYVRLVPQDFGSLASGHFPSASQKSVFRQSPYNSKMSKVMPKSGIQFLIFGHFSTQFF
jgi:hypothetical protein